MILHPDGPGLIAILQSAHAFLAFQLADHWGNRETPRPSPRPDVLAAVLLHDAGWDDREVPPRCAAGGEPLAFDTLPEAEREALWTGAVERAGVRGRYIAYLVSSHVSHLAAHYSSTPHPAFLAGEEARRAGLAAELDGDPRYAPLFRTRGDEVNRAVLRLADALAVHLARGAVGRIVIPGLPRRSGSEPLELEAVGPRAYRLRPWPLVGARLRVHAEGVRLPARTFSDEACLRSTWAAAPVVRLTWTLLAPGERHVAD